MSSTNSVLYGDDDLGGDGEVVGNPPNPNGTTLVTNASLETEDGATFAELPNANANLETENEGSNLIIHIRRYMLYRGHSTTMWT